MAITVEQWTNYTKVVFDSATNSSTTFPEQMPNLPWTEAHAGSAAADMYLQTFESTPRSAVGEVRDYNANLRARGRRHRRTLEPDRRSQRRPGCDRARTTKWLPMRGVKPPAKKFAGARARSWWPASMS